MKIRLLVITFLLVCSNAYSQVLSSQQIDSLVERTMRTFDVPGIAVGVVKDGKLIHAKGYGVSSLKTKERVDENTLFGIASNTKAFTAAALGLLVDEGKLQWDDKVIKHIPEFQLYDPYVTREFTVRDLLTHRSGLGLGAGDLMLFPGGSDFTPKDIIHNLRFLKPVSGFRTKYDYDNLLYIVAGEVLTRASGRSWDDFVEERLLGPLGMARSAAAYDRLKDRTNVIDGHASVEGKVQVIPRHEGKADHAAGSIYSSVADLGKWVALHLNHGKYGDALGKVLFSDEVHEEMWSPQTILPLRNASRYNSHFSAYGLGFFITDVKGHKQVSHTGGLEGMVTQVTMLPELNLGIIVLTNQQEGSAFSSITNQIKDGYLGMPKRDWVTQLSTARQKSLEGARQTTDSLWQAIALVQKGKKGKGVAASIVGTYQDPWFGDVTISERKGRLRFDSKRSWRLAGEVFAYKGDSFIVKWDDRSMDADAFLNFSVGQDGKASGITMKPISPLTDFSYDFQDLDLRRVQ